MTTSEQMPARLDLSIIIPVYNESSGVISCWKAITETLSKSSINYEIIFVDDGSEDDSLNRLLSINDNKVHVLKLTHNVGQQRAMFTALGHCRGATVITYDSDLQFAPECILELHQQISSGYDIAGGIRIARKDGFWQNRLPSMIGQYLINKALGIRQQDFGAVKAYSFALVQRIIRTAREPIIIPATAYVISRNFIEIPVQHQERKEGVSKWSTLKRMELYFDIYTLYADRPFAWIMLIGFGCFFLGVLLGFGILLYKLFVQPHFSGVIIFFDVFLLIFGLHFVSLSLIGEFVVRIHRKREQHETNLIETHYTGSRLTETAP
ncbi:family 2 glycosyl transferase [Oleiphilus messinensis]|uniref:Family 2 glycosyl transferase n=1 Tax=Oleiphilus messinensis TaxID=141451 RepID=A0A1Y0IG94_9GAMM|nr:glycosyltransferase [Oleiphilus messinensis]ARU59511.1 family 2 glycosyl transferase [Oleiphilus messinensis]